MMPTILVTGAANGLGAAFVDAYRRDPQNRIIALDRVTCKLQPANSNVQAYLVDVGSQISIDSFAHKIRGQCIDLVIHSAGIRGLVPDIEDQKPDDVAACETLDVMDVETLTRAFQINAIGTFMLLRAILPNLRLSSNAKCIVMSSRMGSVGNNQHPNKDAGSAYAYRASKAALNTIVRSFAADVTDVAFILCHPGRVETKLVKTREAGAISAEESVSSILPLIDTWSREDSGKFYDRFGEKIEW